MSARRTLIPTFIALALCVAGASAGTANTVTIEDVTLQPGATQEVSIRLLGSTGVSGVMVTLTFSPSIVNVTSVVVGNFDGRFTPDCSGVNNGVLKVTTMKSGPDLAGDLTLATITLGAVGGGGSCELGLYADLTDQSGNAVTSSVDNGTLTVGSGATTDNVTNESTFEGGDNPAASTPTAAPTLALTSPPSPIPTPTVTTNATTTTTTTTANTAAPAAAATTAAATTQTTTAPVAGGDETMPGAPAKKGLPGFEGVFAVAGLLAIAYVVMWRKR